MRAALSLILALALTAPAFAQEDTPQTEAAEDAAPALLVVDASEVTLEEFRWVARPIIVFADTPRDPRFQDQIDLLLQRPGPLLERDIVVIVDSDPGARSDARQTLRPRGFSMVILQRDGAVALRKPTPWSVREIMRAIDNLPMRIDEMRNAQ
ncbi:MAG: hypothetical protein COW55_15740 [Rhodobacteraceae bacterium CG17_big_fil_post_rev_8_21_14_2_50_65_11]|nr:MAG: hypothetical protein COW55_15740 [Rhodobacteraceae bacterium CG17_big_fil_post_rev_8_21_14_2_50_65_11]